MSNGKFLTTWFHAGHKTNERVVSKGFLGMKSEVQKEPSATEINLDEFATMLEQVYTDMDKKGYDVINVLPLAMAVTEPVHALKGGNKNYIGQATYSPTKGAVVVGKRRDDA